MAVYSGTIVHLASVLLWFILLLKEVAKVSGNVEVDALNAFKDQLRDPDDVLQSWDSTHIKHCDWFHVTCNDENNVIRIDLGEANLSGQLVPQLGKLTRLENLELYRNNITGRIPNEIGNLTNLLTLDLQFNRLDGVIPDSLGKLWKLSQLRLNNNLLTGTIPIPLTALTSLQVLDLSNNDLSGDVPINGSFSQVTSVSFAGNPNMRASRVLKTTTPPSSHSRRVRKTGTGLIVKRSAAFVLITIVTAFIWFQILTCLMKRITNRKIEKVLSP